MKKALIIFGINDETISDKWGISSIKTILEKINDFVSSGDFSKIVLVDSSNYYSFNKYSIVNIKKFNNPLFSNENELKILSHDNEEILLNSNQIDYILPVNEYKITVAGLDLLGSLSDGIKDLNKIGYHITVHPNLIKAWKNITYDKIRGLCQISKI